MRHHRGAWKRWVGIGLPLTLALGAPAAASEPADDPPTTKRAAEILDHMDWENEPQTKADLFARFGIDRRQGLAYRRSAELGGRPIEWGLYGPVQRRTTFGLGFKVKF